MTDQQTATITAPELNADFNEDRQLANANAVGQSNATIVPADGKKYSLVTFSAARGVGVLFKGEGLIDKLRTDGRTTIKLDAVNFGEKAANKTVTADAVTTSFYPDGKNIRRAEAVGNAEVVVQPLTATPKNYVTTIDAPRFDCDFYPTGNNAKNLRRRQKKPKPFAFQPFRPQSAERRHCSPISSTPSLTPKRKTSIKWTPSVPRNLPSLIKTRSRDNLSILRADEMMRLRGGEPTVWDGQGRTKAREIDLDKKTNKSYLPAAASARPINGKKQIKNSAPFATSDKPVFVTSESGRI